MIGSQKRTKRTKQTSPLSPLAKRLQWVLLERQDEFPSRRALCDAAGLGHSYVSLVMSGERARNGIETESARKLADATGYPFEWFLSGANPPTGYPGDGAAMARRETPATGLRLRVPPGLAAAIELLGTERLHQRAVAAACRMAEAGEGADWSRQRWVDELKALHEEAKSQADWDPGAA